ncbi:hypothetical protein [Kaistia granuli]|uniref:hypothetical protein n=1 Tax=Kaistia granuli TaxID=363259 RepID=UPI000380AF06|nr:hypothetical protein [Kaistia granuli]
MGLKDLFSDKNEEKAAQALKDGYGNAKNEAYGQIDTGVSNANADYTKALGLYAPLSDTYNRGSSLYADALGLNGADGNGRAAGAYQTGPGYQFATDQAIQALERRAGAQGRLGSGQTGLDTLSAVYGLADQDYGNWLERLSGYDGKALGAADSQAGLYGAKAGMGYDAGVTKAGYGWNAATGAAGAQSDFLKGKDQTGANIIGTALGGISAAKKIFG